MQMEVAKAGERQSPGKERSVFVSKEDDGKKVLSIRNFSCD